MLAMLSRLVASTLLVLFLLGSWTAAECAGWQGTGEDRMDCCAAANHDCTAANADGCCASQEQGQHARLDHASAPVLVPEVRLVTYCVPDLKALTASHLAVGETPAARGDTYLLISVLLV